MCVPHEENGHQVEAEAVPEVSEQYPVKSVPTFVVLKVLVLLSCSLPSNPKTAKSHGNKHTEVTATPLHATYFMQGGKATEVLEGAK